MSSAGPIHAIGPKNKEFSINIDSVKSHRGFRLDADIK